MTIQEALNNIKNAVFGRDVRQSIHDGIDTINKESKADMAAKQKTIDTYTMKMDLMDDKYEEQIKNMTLESPSDAEIVDARRTAGDTVYSTLKERLDEDKNSIWLRKEGTYKSILNEDENQNGQLEIAGLKDAILDNSTMSITPVLKSGNGDTVPGSEILRIQTLDYASANIGAKNLLKNTKTLGSGFSKPAKATINAQYLGPAVYKNEFVGGSYAEDLRCNNVITPSPGSYYTLSFYAKGAGEIDSYFHPDTCESSINSQGGKSDSADGYSIFSLSDNWERYWVTWKTKTDASGAKNVIVCRQRGADNSTVYICGVKLEEGETATPWTANQEDVDAKCILMSLSRSALDSLSYDISNDQATGPFPVDLNVKVSYLSPTTKRINEFIGNPEYLETTSKTDLVSSINELNRNLLQKVFPVGAIYISVNSTDPGILFGGTWERWGIGRVPVGVSENETEFATADKTGGEKVHTLTVNEIPSHQHSYDIFGIDGQANTVARASNGQLFGIVNMADMKVGSGKEGLGYAHNNLQPYITCYMWVRRK